MSVGSDWLPASSLAALVEAAGVINSTLQLDSVLGTIARLACAVTRTEASCVFLLDARAGRLTVPAATGSRRDAFIGREFDARMGVPGQVLRSGRPVILTHAWQDGRFVKEIDNLGSLRTRSIMAVPMVHRGQTIGVIEVANRLDETDFSDSDLNLLHVFATLAAGATQNARAYEELQRKYEGLRDSVLKNPPIIGQSPQLREVLALCDRVAASPATVLLLGQTGTGKELCARYIHNRSRRRNETFVAVNCAALSETLLESELFGHEKGAFTDAHAQRRGWFELAHQGTLFLDEIGDISPATQVKLLRVLQEREFVRVGGSRPIPCDVRLIAATNRDLRRLMAEGRFREDLYYRLSVFPICVPALRERAEDIPLLVEHFIRRSAETLGTPPLRVAPRTMELLCRYHWPGNIRELQNVVERSVLMADGPELLPEHLPPEIELHAAGERLADAADGPPAEAPTLSLEGHERALILKTLAECGWNQSKAARVLSITRDYLRHRIRKYGLHRPASAAPMSGGEEAPAGEQAGDLAPAVDPAAADR